MPKAHATPRGKIPNGVGIKIIAATFESKNRRMVKKNMKNVGSLINFPSSKYRSALKCFLFINNRLKTHIVVDPGLDLATFSAKNN